MQHNKIDFLEQNKYICQFLRNALAVFEIDDDVEIKIVNKYSFSTSKGGFNPNQKYYFSISPKKLKEHKFSINENLESFYESVSESLEYLHDINVEVIKNFRKIEHNEIFKSVDFLINLFTFKKDCIKFKKQKASFIIFQKIEESHKKIREILAKTIKIIENVKNAQNDFEFYFIFWSGDINFNSNYPEIKKIIEGFLNSPFNFYFLSHLENQIKYCIEENKTTFIVVDNEGKFYNNYNTNLLDNDNIIVMINEFRNKSKFELSYEKYSREIKQDVFQQLENEIENYHYFNKGQGFSLEFLKKLISIEIESVQNFVFHNYMALKSVHFYAPSIEIKTCSEGEIIVNNFKNQLKVNNLLEFFDWKNYEILSDNSKDCVKTIYNKINMLDFYLPKKNFKINSKSFMNSKGVTLSISTIKNKNKDKIEYNERLIKCVNELLKEYNIRIETLFVKENLTLICPQLQPEISDFDYLIVQVVTQYSEVNSLDLTFRAFFNNLQFINKRTKALFIIHDEIYQTCSNKYQNYLQIENSFKIFIFSLKVSNPFYFTIMNSLSHEYSNNLFVLNDKNKIIYSSKGEHDINNIVNLVATNNFQVLKPMNKIDSNLLDLLFSEMSNSTKNLLKEIKYHFKFSLEKDQKFYFDNDFNIDIKEKGITLFFHAKSKDIKSIQEVISNTFSKITPDLKRSEILKETYVEISQVRLKYGKECHQCHVSIISHFGHYYCYWCKIYFCIPCAEAIFIENNGINRLSHPHNLIYISCLSKNEEEDLFLDNIDEYKLGINASSNFFPNSAYQNHNGHCDCCFALILTARYICLNCRPGCIVLGGYRDYCQSCFRILRNPENPQHMSYRNTCLGKDNHDVCHKYLRIYFSTGNYQMF